MVHVGKLNDKYHIIFFTNTVLNAAVLSTTSVLQFISLPQMKKERGKKITNLKLLGHSEMQNMKMDLQSTQVSKLYETLNK